MWIYICVTLFDFEKYMDTDHNKCCQKACLAYFLYQNGIFYAVH